MSTLLIRYLLVGGLNTAFGYTVFAAVTYQGQPYPRALFVATIAGILFNFKTFGRLVFAQSDWRLLWRFVTVYGLLYVINVGCVFFLMMLIHNVYVANAIALVFIAGLGFLLNRRFVYANH
jgi:putative flippase GtrA